LTITCPAEYRKGRRRFSPRRPDSALETCRFQAQKCLGLLVVVSNLKRRTIVLAILRGPTVNTGPVGANHHAVVVSCVVDVGYHVGDIYDRLVEVKDSQTSVATYTYDALNRRVTRTASSTTTRFIYDGSRVIEEYQPGSPDTLLRKFIYGTYVDDPGRATPERTTTSRTPATAPWC